MARQIATLQNKITNILDIQLSGVDLGTHTHKQDVFFPIICYSQRMTGYELFLDGRRPRGRCASR
jgi:hypothetical protein